MEWTLDQWMVPLGTAGRFTHSQTDGGTTPRSAGIKCYEAYETGAGRAGVGGGDTSTRAVALFFSHCVIFTTGNRSDKQVLDYETISAHF